MKKLFGTTAKGEDVYLHIIENDAVRIGVLDYGATLVLFEHKGTGTDAVLGYDDLAGYVNQQGSCIGASIGRTANRTGKGVFCLNGKTYHLAINNNGNSLHGGLEGFDKKVFTAEESEQEVIFRRLSPDMEEGYPGNLQVEICYTLLPDGFEITASGSADQDTLFAYTNHSYFNLTGKDSVLDHVIEIPSDYYGLSDENGMMKDQLAEVSGTPFDFRVPKPLGQDITSEHEQIVVANGYDHYYDIEGTGMRRMAVCRAGGLELTMESDFPGFHLYSGNFLYGDTGKKGHVYPPRSGVCFEAEYYPNAINYDSSFTKPIVRAGTVQTNHIRFHLNESREH
ncbi:MAG: galactose mutarotase [Solobacterium sp.]|nr:galactose mutarotase [Solobacterium sp.]